MRTLQSDCDNIISAVVCDIDGVLADNSGRLAALDRENPDWVAFHATIHEDPLLPATAALLRMLHRGGVKVFLLTNRPERLRPPTQGWLDAHGVPYDRLLMRNGHTYESAKVVAIEELRKQYRIECVIDDDPELCAAIQAAHPEIPVLYCHSGYYDLGRVSTENYA